MKTLQEQLQTLEDELEVPRQDLEEKKREEMQRRKKVENFKKEIQVSRVLLCLCFIARMFLEVAKQIMRVATKKELYAFAIALRKGLLG